MNKLSTRGGERHLVLVPSFASEASFRLRSRLHFASSASLRNRVIVGNNAPKGRWVLRTLKSYIQSCGSLLGGASIGAIAKMEGGGAEL